jgi:hypothetical protein
VSGKVLLDRCDGAIEFLHHDEDGDRFIVETVADIEPVVEANKVSFNDSRRVAGAEFRRVASYPPIVREIYARLWGADPFAKGNEELLRRLLNDPDLRHFRTAPGRV